MYLYLANDVIQESRRRGTEFVNEFSKIIKDAVLHIWNVSTEAIQKKIMRVVEVWDQRRVFPSNFVKSIYDAVQESQDPTPPAKTSKTPLTSVPTKYSMKVSPKFPNNEAEEDGEEIQLDVDTIQSKFETFSQYKTELKTMEKIEGLLSQNSAFLSELAESEKSVREISPNCLQFTPVQLEQIRKGDPVPLRTLISQLEQHQNTLAEYKSQLENDISISTQLHGLLAPFVHHLRSQLKEKEEGLIITNHLINSSKVLRRKIEQRIGQDQEDDLEEETQKESVPIILKKNSNSTNNDSRKRPSTAPKPMQLEEYKRRKMATQTGLTNSELNRDNKDIM